MSEIRIEVNTSFFYDIKYVSEFESVLRFFKKAVANTHAETHLLTGPFVQGDRLIVNSIV